MGTYPICWCLKHRGKLRKCPNRKAQAAYETGERGGISEMKICIYRNMRFSTRECSEGAEDRRGADRQVTLLLENAECEQPESTNGKITPMKRSRIYKGSTGKRGQLQPKGMVCKNEYGVA